MTVLLTGAAPFVVFHVAQALLERGERVLGIDDLNPYYDVRLEQARLARLALRSGFAFRLADVAERGSIHDIVKENKDLKRHHSPSGAGGVRRAFAR